MKDFDAFSFRPKSSKRRHNSRHLQHDFQPPVIKPSSVVNPTRNNNPSPKNWRQMTYRFEKNLNNTVKIPMFQSYYVNERINKIDEQLTQNIRRRIELQKKLYKEKQQIRQNENQKVFQQNHYKTDSQSTQLFVNMQKKTDSIQKKLQRQQKNDSMLSYLDSVEKKQAKRQQYLLIKQQKQKKYVVPDQVRIQKLIKALTFPQIPKCNLQKIEKECQQIMINSQHSDIVYLMMVVSFHLQKYNNVRKYFRQIQMYKVFQAKAYWVACETEYQLQSYQLCLKLADKCMKQLSDIHLPRFVFLQARSYEKLGNFVNSIVCYNQLIKMRPKIAELYLQRAMIYDKIGYPHEAKLDYIQFSTLEPDARQYLRQKIMTQKNQIKRKEMIKALAKIS